jgi:hypothetical protein
MDLPLPKTRTGWIALIIGTCIVIAFLYFATNVFKGHAIEVSVENAGTKDIFAHIDNTGRHGENTDTISLKTTNGSSTPPGLRISPGTTRSFGMAVGLFDSPTLHVWSINDGGIADSTQITDCTFDTVSYQKLQIPSIHVTLKWNGSHCEHSP